MSELVEVHREGRVMRLALNRPEKRNALSVALCRELLARLHEAADDPSTGAVLLTGNGPAFCAGMDLAEFGKVPLPEVNQLHEELFSMRRWMTKPVVAAVHGPALGGGTGVVANCHIVLASPEATFGLTEIKLGLFPFLIFRPMVEAVGERRAAELALTGRIFSASEALHMALVHEFTTESGLLERALETSVSIAGRSPSAVAAGLDFLLRQRTLEAPAATELARETRDALFAAEDFHEGVAAFLEKRPAIWPSLGKNRGIL